MSFTEIESPFIVVTVDGDPVDIESVTITEGIMPEVGSASFSVKVGRRLSDGSVVTTEPAIAQRDVVEITCGDYLWRGQVAYINKGGLRSVNGSPGGRTFNVTAYGLGAQLDRGYFRTWRKVSTFGGAISAPFDGNFNEGGRPDRSAGTFSVGGSSVYVSAPGLAGSERWTQRQAIDTILAVGKADLGWPTIVLEGDGLAALTKTATFLVRGRSGLAAIAQILGLRSDVVWRLYWNGTEWRMKVSLVAGSGTTVDLTGPRILDYSVESDSRATQKACTIQGNPKVYVLTLLHYPASGSGDLLKDWGSSDITNREAGDRNSPAYRKFIPDDAYALPDTSSVGNGRLMSTLPIQVSSAFGVVGGPEYSTSILLFAKFTDTSPWVSLTNQISINVRDKNIEISGSEWESIYKQMAAEGGRFAITVAVQSVNRLNYTLTGGDGEVDGLIEAQADYVRVLNAYVGVSSGGTIEQATSTVRDDSATLSDALDAVWPNYEVDRVTVNWLDLGREPQREPGDRLTAATVPLTASTSESVTLQLAVVTKIITKWTPEGVLVEYRSDPLPASDTSIAG
jgi:hypothetical protein